MPRRAKASLHQRAALAELRAQVAAARADVKAAREVRKGLLEHAKKVCAECKCKHARTKAKDALAPGRRARARARVHLDEKAHLLAQIYGRPTSKEKLSEKEDAVTREIGTSAPELLSYWGKVRKEFLRAGKTPEAIATAFLESVSDHPGEVASYIAKHGDEKAERLIKERERELASLERQGRSVEVSAPPEEEDFLSWLEKNPPPVLVALGDAIEVETASGRLHRFPRGTILAYAPKRAGASLFLVYGAKKSRRSPPPSAAKEYERTHWGNAGPWGTSAGERPHAVGRGVELARIVYATKKGGDTQRTFYEHDFEQKRPRLAGRQLVGGSYRVTERGIVG